ncbi:MAG TPA: dithiol-disulfide isomerase, partial [Nitrospiraceae bacterium]|nr:dithiol-disulfide isomerase [Nitrospiraceae bacterium]
FQPEPSFIYDTEPPSRALIVVRQLAPDKEFPFLKSVQEAFYVRNEDVTREKVLADLAGSQNIDRGRFLAGFKNSAIKQSVWGEFDRARQLGVSGFPTLLGQYGHDRITFTHGYQSTGGVVPMIDEWLRRLPVGISKSSIG